MKRLIILMALLFLGVHNIKAQLSSKKTHIEFNAQDNLNLESIYSVNQNNRSEANYVVTKSKVEIPIAYESYHDYSEHSNIDNNKDANLTYFRIANYNVPNLQTFAVFTIVNTNAFPIESLIEDVNHLNPDLKKHLPQGFNPYYGMFEDQNNSISLHHPFISR